MRNTALTAFAAIMVLSNGLFAHDCPKCMRIESERAEAQAKAGGVQNTYYDDYIKSHEGTVSEGTEIKHKTSKYHESYNSKSGLLEEELKDEPTPEHVKKEPQGAEEKTEKKLTLALNAALSFKKTDLDKDADVSTIFDIFSLKDLFETFEGPFTLFVPTDAAILKYPDAPGLLKPENRELLYTMIINHVVPKQIIRSDAGKVFKTLGGRNVELKSDENEGLSVNGLPILKGDAIGNAGVVYVIDSVLIPIHE